MRITQVYYERLRSFGNYENERIGATAFVTGEDTEEATLAQLEAWVCDKLGVKPVSRPNAQADAIRQEIADLRATLQQKEAELNQTAAYDPRF